MNHCLNDITLDPAWREEQVDRLLGFEILQNALNARYAPVEPARLADKISADKGIAYRILQSIKTNHARR